MKKLINEIIDYLVDNCINEYQINIKEDLMGSKINIIFVRDYIRVESYLFLADQEAVKDILDLKFDIQRGILLANLK